MTVLQDPQLLHQHSQLLPGITHGCCNFAFLRCHIRLFIRAVLHNICHGIELLCDHIPVFLQPVIPGHIQMRFFKYQLYLFDQLFPIRTVFPQLGGTLLHICLPAPLQCLQKPVQNLIHRHSILFPANRTLITGRTDPPRHLRLHPSQFLCGKILFVSVHFPKRTGQFFKRFRILIQTPATRCIHNHRHLTPGLPVRDHHNQPTHHIDKAGHQNAFANADHKPGGPRQMQSVPTQSNHYRNTATQCSRHMGTAMPCILFQPPHQCRTQ